MLLLAGACVVVVAAAGFVVVTEEGAGFDAVTFWRRCSTTAGLFVVGFAGAGTSVSEVAGSLGAGVGAGVVVAVVVGAGAGVLEVGVEVVVVGCVLVSSLATSLGVVVTAPSEAPPDGVPAASAVETGASPTAVSAAFAHLVVVPCWLSAQLAHKRGVRPPGFISADKHEGVKDS
jgi:hypothetical protein